MSHTRAELDDGRLTARPYGEAAVLLSVAGRGGDDPAVVASIARALRADFPGADVVAGASSLAVVGLEPTDAARRAVVASAGRAIEGGVATAEPSAREHAIDVCYDGPDLDEVAALTGRSRTEIVERHAGRPYRVAVLGFLPGFAYLTGLDPALELPRRARPRTVVEASSVAIAGPYTGIYPFASPGGWHLVGRARSPGLFDPARDPPARWTLGDRVTFVPVEGWPAESKSAPREAGARPPCFEVLRAGPALTVQDAGRPGRLGDGLPPSGPLDPEAMAAAHRAVGNDEGAAALEIPMSGLRLRYRADALSAAPAWVSIDGEPAFAVADGAEVEITAGPSLVRYLAVRGGFDVPLVLGSRATLRVAGLGGLGGRAIGKGDRIPLTVRTSRPDAAARAAPPPDPGDPARLPIVWGPDDEAFDDASREVLLQTTFVVSPQADRVGVRLAGASIPRRGDDCGRPQPMIRGAVQVTTDGTPIVLGPDHAVTGGYPVIAVLRRRAQALLARLRPGARLRFVSP